MIHKLHYTEEPPGKTVEQIQIIFRNLPFQEELWGTLMHIVLVSHFGKQCTRVQRTKKRSKIEVKEKKMEQNVRS